MILKKLLLSLAVLLAILSCSTDEEKEQDIITFVPGNSVYIIKSNNLNSFLGTADSLSLLKNNQNLINSKYWEQLESLAGYLSGPSLICLTRNSGGEYDYTFLSESSPQAITTDSVKNKSVETFKYENFEITHYTLENANFFTSGSNGILLASNSRTQLENILTKEDRREDEFLNKIFSAADPAKTSIIVNHQLLDKDLQKFFESSKLPFQNLSSWSIMDLDIEGEKIFLNGISTWKDNEDILSIFKGTTPQNNLLATVTPADATGFYSFTYSDFSQLNQNLNKIDSTREELSANHLLNYTREAGLIFTAEDVILALTTTDAILAKEAIISENEFLEDHRNISIFRFTEDPQIADHLRPLIKKTDFNFFAHVDDFILFAEASTTLKKVISDYLNKNTLSEQESYSNAMSNLASSSSLLMVANSEGLKSEMLETASSEIKTDIQNLNLESYPLIAFQFVAEEDFAHLHGVFNTTRTSSITKSTQQLAAIEINNSTIATTVFPLINDDTKATEVAFQDAENILHLYSSGGKLLWKKQVDGRITGKIHQVDLFKNGNLQLAFSTQNSFTVLDGEGNTVKPFPIKYKDDVTQPLSVFDYDNNRNYRFVITQDKEILMYDSKGSIVKGFDFTKAASNILQSPQHIRLGNKDYIVFPEENGKLNILSRQGNQRVKVNGDVNFSESNWYEYKNNFVSINTEGELVKINEDGNISKEKTEFEVNPFLVATENVLVLQSENNLKINENLVTLDFGLYTKPQIFKIGGKTYIAITDTQAQKVFVFNQDANLLPGLPVYGTSAVDINQGQDNTLILGVKGEDNSAVLYSLKQ